MTEDPKNKSDVTPEGVVEVTEKDLDQAAGGLIGLLLPAVGASPNDNEIEYAGQKVTPQNLASGGPHVAPQKKI